MRSRRLTWNILPILLFLKSSKIFNCRLSQIIGDALWVKRQCDQELPQSQTADQPMLPEGLHAEHILSQLKLK